MAETDNDTNVAAGTEATLEERLAEATDHAATYLANWQRAQADFINLKRRIEHERLETARFANADLIAELLPVLDDLERALDSPSLGRTAAATWVEGVRLIERKLHAILEGRGLSEIEALGQEFDPNLHEAIAQAPGAPGKVVAVHRSGYQLHDRVLRPAQVLVGAYGSDDS